MTKLIAIAALGKSYQIGLEGGLPWKIPNEYQHFQDTVKDEFIIVGRRNFELQSDDIKLSHPLILTRQEGYSARGVGRVFTDLDSIRFFLKDQKAKQAYVIGGEQIYKFLYPNFDEMKLSFVDYDGAADTYFPQFDESEWVIKTKDKRENYLFVHYTRSSMDQA